MSRFYVVEFRSIGRKRWRPWKREQDRHQADRDARSLLDRHTEARVVHIDTDAATVRVVYLPGDNR